MSELVSFELAEKVLGVHFISVEEIGSISNLNLYIPNNFTEIPYSLKELEDKKDDYFLLPGVGKFRDGKYVTIRNMIQIFGKDPDIQEPCFYNQDWYEKEDFIDTPMEDGWFFIRKEVFDDSRAVQPVELLKKYVFPSAIICVYAFFVIWLTRNKKLWYHDFVWCSDLDHNGDRIYVGKYHDIDGINKNGFSIHRHLALRPCYGAID